MSYQDVLTALGRRKPICPVHPQLVLPPEGHCPTCIENVVAASRRAGVSEKGE